MLSFTMASSAENFEYSLCQKKRSFHSHKTLGPKNSPKTCHSLVKWGFLNNHVNFWPPSPRGATKKIRIKCAFLLKQTVLAKRNIIDYLATLRPGGGSLRDIRFLVYEVAVYLWSNTIDME